ncbi:MAG: hypothetical protein IIX36_05020, partial [Clostridia bacterium]|nr:hypothetical protein [Clostridia bacterium]
MYDLSGIKHLILFSDLPMFLMALLLLVLDWKKISKSIKKKRWEKGAKGTLFLIAFCTLWFIISGGINVYHIHSPDISCFEGEYLRGYRANEARLSSFSWRYVFDDGAEPHEAFYLDSFSKKEIFNKDFEEGIKYRIYYEEKD